jgi:uncharacterized membrane protein
LFAISLIQQLGPCRLSRSELFIRLAASIAALLLALFGKGIASLAIVGLLVLLLVIIAVFEVAGYERSKSDDESTDNTDAAGLTR